MLAIEATLTYAKLTEGARVTNSVTKTNRRWQAKASWLLLACYWLTLGVGTHLPPAAIDSVATLNDKAIHAGAYCLFALIAAIAWRLTFGSFHRPAALTLLFVLGIIGAVDELTQPYFRRSCELGDWAADVTGVAIGLVLFRIVLAVTAFRTKRRATLLRSES